MVLVVDLATILTNPQMLLQFQPLACAERAGIRQGSKFFEPFVAISMLSVRHQWFPRSLCTDGLFRNRSKPR